MQRYFLAENYHSGPFLLTGEQFHHAAHVMRMKSGQQVYLVFSDEVAVVAELTEVMPESLCFAEVRKETQKKELPTEITLACGLTKGDKLEWVVQKATELGAAAFFPFAAASSVVKWDAKKQGKKLERLAKIAQEAAEQAQRTVTPKFAFFESAQALTDKFADFDVVVVAYEEAAKAGEISVLQQVLSTQAKGQKILALFGPEGGFTPVEIRKFESAGALLCGLGPRILRAETAPLYFLSAASYVWELAIKS